METKYDTDVVMRKLLLHLAEDFRTVNGIDYASGPINGFLRGGIKGYRAYKFPARCQAPPYLFKQEAQLENLFKRYRFKDDVYSNAELTAITMKKFVDTQERIAAPLDLTPTAFLVLQRARRIITNILGNYDSEEHKALCRFGKRSCARVPYSKSYLDIKLGIPITGSKDHIAWFNNYLQSDSMLSDVICECQGKPRPIYEMCDTLPLVLVPKSYKSLRTVKPPSLVGSFYTYGLGRLIQSKLLRVGLNIRRLQEKHKRLVIDSSRTRKNVTADLSAASDSISRELLLRLLPKKWYRAVMLGFIPSTSHGGLTYGLQSVMTMGDGHTFPLQTLVFYSIIMAIAELKGSPQSFVSVYGDDLIYSRGLHPYVRYFFPKFHLLLNGDKTYAEDYFRESCGSDAYRGFDVRPYSYQGECQLLGRQPYAVFLYKLLNGLRLRWVPEEIPGTINYLLAQLILTQDVVFQVPPSFPDGSGFKTAVPKDLSFFSPVVYSKKMYSWVFNYLHVASDFRVVECQSPYLWERLRSSNTSDEGIFDLWDQGDEPILKWRKATCPPRLVRSRITGSRLRRLVAGVSSKTSSSIIRQTGSTSCWI